MTDGGAGWTTLAREGICLAQSFARRRRAWEAARDLPRGDGHAVMVLPGLFSHDRLTHGFRVALSSLNYGVEGWGPGINFGPTPEAWHRTVEHLAELTDRSGGAVSLIGHSLGGVFARALAAQQPEQVRRVITVCSPFRAEAASPLLPLYRLLALRHIDETIFRPLLAVPPSVPTTAIYSPSDGVVDWTCCIDDPATGRENIAIDNPHSTILGNPETLRIVAERLARPPNPIQPSAAARRSGSRGPAPSR